MYIVCNLFCLLVYFVVCPEVGHKTDLLDRLFVCFVMCSLSDFHLSFTRFFQPKTWAVPVQCTPIYSHVIHLLFGPRTSTCFLYMSSSFVFISHLTITYAHSCVYVCTCVYVCMHACMYVYVCTCMYVLYKYVQNHFAFGNEPARFKI